MTSGTAAISAVASALDARKATPTPNSSAGDAIDGCGGIAPGLWIIALGPTASQLLRASARSCATALSAPAWRCRLRFRRFHHLPERMRRAALVSAALTLAGVFAVRYAVVNGGRQSADDPQATFDMTG